MERAMAPTAVLLPGKSHGRRSLVGCSPWGHKESDTTEQLHFDFSLSCTGEGNGNPLQCSCLENPRDSGAWWAAVYGVAQSRTRLKRLSSSSSSSSTMLSTLYCLSFFTHSNPRSNLGVWCYWWPHFTNKKIHEVESVAHLKSLFSAKSCYYKKCMVVP